VPTEAKIDSSRIESRWPSGHGAGALASLIDRRASKVDSQVRQRYSYNGIGPIVVLTSSPTRLAQLTMIALSDSAPQVSPSGHCGFPSLEQRCDTYGVPLFV